ncbi:MAG: GC-type dockerin domain-anchored protein [Phycisphaerales bacterium]
MRVALCVLLTVCFAIPVAAQPFEIERFTIDGGGGTLAGGSYTLTGTIGQPDAGVLAAGSIQLSGGFWVNNAPTTGRLCADQNEDGVVDPADFTGWVVNYNGGDLRADANQNGVLDPGDFTAWIVAFNQGELGPICTP